MAVRRILSYYDEEDRKILQSKSEPVEDIMSEETQQLIQDLKDTLLNANSLGGGLVGLSAIQIGEPKQICVIKYDIYFLTIINPIVTRTRGDIVYQEGCASCSGAYIQTHRFQKV
jgi:peptide deformylase